MNKKELGALWERKSQKGMTFLSGNVEINGKKIEIVAFRSTEKKNEKQPDWRIYESEERVQRIPPPVKWTKPEMEESDIPF